MVIVHRDLCKESCFLRVAVVFGVEFAICHSGSLKVRYERELKGVIIVSFKSAVAVIKVALQLDRIFCVILQKSVPSGQKGTGLHHGLLPLGG